MVAESSVSMTLCPHCGGHEVETLGDSSRQSASPEVPASPEVSVPPEVGEDAA